MSKLKIRKKKADITGEILECEASHLHLSKSLEQEGIISFLVDCRSGGKKVKSYGLEVKNKRVTISLELTHAAEIRTFECLYHTMLECIDLIHH